MIPAGVVHVAAAVIAMSVGAVMFGSQKGTKRHLRLGYLYLAAMVNVNVAAWTVDTGGTIGPFHVLTIVSVVTLVGAYSLVVTGRPGAGRRESHGVLMAWSYAGVVSAGLGQAAVATDAPVGAVIGLSLALAGLIIHVIRPAALRLHPPTKRRSPTP